MDTREVIESYNRSAAVYAKTSLGTENTSMLKQLVDLTKPHAKVLDVGAAAGRDTRILKDMGFDVIGVDLSEKLLDIARKTNPDLTFVLGDMLKLPFKDQTFDAVWASGVLHHVSRNKMEIALGEYNRVLAPNGVLHVYTKEGKGILQTREASVANELREFNLLSADELDALLQKAGFSKLSLGVKPSKTRKNLTWLSTFYKKSA